jgi:alpha-beta hydrolase superfamily lysophospholipase
MTRKLKTLFVLLCLGIYTHNLQAQFRFEPDVLGYPFEQLKINQGKDYEGDVTCTLVHYQEQTQNLPAVLYIHGFNDYFFQKEMAEKFHMNGIAFYALDLRKYGRSWQAHQKLNNVRDLAEYDADIDTALSIIKALGHGKILLLGHSTGGLIATLYAAKNQGSKKYDALACNSPFYDYNIGFLLKRLGVPILSAIGKNHPDKLFKAGIPPEYGESLYKGAHGEWEYNLSWKPHSPPDVNLGWIRAIHKGHKAVNKGLKFDKPVLVMRASKSIYEKNWSEKMFTGDAVLDVKDMAKAYKKMDAVKIELVFENAIHDLVLSKKATREKVYEDLFIWCEKYFLYNQ